MIKLLSRGTVESGFDRAVLGRITTMPVPENIRRDYAFLLKASTPTVDLKGYAAVVLLSDVEAPKIDAPVTRLSPMLDPRQRCCPRPATSQRSAPVMGLRRVF